MAGALSSVNIRTPERSRPLGYEGNFRQHSADSVNPSAVPITSW